MGLFFIVASIEDTMAWLALLINAGAYVIPHCGGSFDFQMILRFFLSDEVLRMKKVKAPLMRGVK